MILNNICDSFVPYGEIVKQNRVLRKTLCKRDFVPYGEIVKQDIDVAIRWANWFPSPMGCLLNLYICLTINVIGVFRPLWGNC